MKITTSRLIALLMIIVFTLLHLWVRWSAFHLPYFHNEDTAGITYSADLILRGGLPLIDTVEMKAPGSFFLLAGWWSWLGRSLESAQLLGVLWSWLAMVGVIMGAWVLYMRMWCAVVAGGLYLYLAPFTDSIDINYGAWMVTPYIWSATLMLVAHRARHRDKLTVHDVSPPLPSSASSDGLDYTYTLCWLLTGVLIACAALMKRQGAAVFPLACLLAYLYAPRRMLALGSLCGGVSGTFLVAFLPYIIRGHGLEAATHYFFSKSGWSYLLSDLERAQHSLTTLAAPARLPRLWDGVVGLGVHVPLAGTLALYNLISQVLLRHQRARSEADETSIIHAQSHPDPLRGHTQLLLCFISLSFVGASLGLRFFKGYYLQVLPGLIWLAVHPYGLPRAWRHAIGALWNRDRWVRRPTLNTLLVLTLISSCGGLSYAARASWMHLQRARSMRARPLYLPARQIKEISQELKRIYDTTQSLNQGHTPARGVEQAANLRPWSSRLLSAEPRSLWVWGRWAWPAYFYTQAASPTRYFKNLGVLTTQLTNTWNPKRRSRPTRFDPHTPWRDAIRELSADPPLFIITAKNEPITGFSELQKLLRRRYQRLSYKTLKVKTHRSRQLFTVYQRRSH